MQADSTTTRATTHLSTILLLLLFLPHSHQATPTAPYTEPLECPDLLTLLDLFRGEFDNLHQTENDTATGASDFHVFIHRFHVPVRVSQLRSPRDYCSFGQQIYLEQYFDGSSKTLFKRIFNFVLKDGRIFMETRRHRNPWATERWENWRQDTKQFERLRGRDLLFNPKCNVEWTKKAVGIYEAENTSQNCTFNFSNGKVYLRSKVHLEENFMTQDEQFLSENAVVVSGARTAFQYRRRENQYIHALASNISQCQIQRCKFCLLLKVAACCVLYRLLAPAA
ncbi:hypothetical protein ACOMHN_032136 [Nucella lapillus]